MWHSGHLVIAPTGKNYVCKLFFFTLRNIKIFLLHFPKQIGFQRHYMSPRLLIWGSHKQNLRKLFIFFNRGKVSVTWDAIYANILDILDYQFSWWHMTELTNFVGHALLVEVPFKAGCMATSQCNAMASLNSYVASHLFHTKIATRQKHDGKLLFKITVVLF